MRLASSLLILLAVFVASAAAVAVLVQIEGVRTTAAAVIAGSLVAVLFLALHRPGARPIAAVRRAMDEVRRFGSDVQPLRTAGGGEVGALTRTFNLMLDELRAREAAAAEQVDQLEQVAAYQTTALQGLRATAEAAELARADLIAMVGREIRSQVEGLSALAAQLAMDAPHGRRRSAAELSRSSASLLAAIDDMLAYPAASAAERDREPVDLAETAEAVCALFWAKASSRRLDLAVYVDPATPRRVDGDGARLRQVIVALVGSAIERSERGGVLIEIEPDSAASVRISVRDTGEIIPKDRLAGLFEPAGQGMALALAKRAVEAMGARLDVASEPGRGTTFAFRLPMTVVEAAAAWPKAREAKARVGIACDGVATRRALGRYLARAGYTPCPEGESVDLFIGGPGALERQQSGAPAICLADPGDAAADALIRQGAAQALLPRPLHREDLEALLARIQSGAPLADLLESGTGEEGPVFAPILADPRLIDTDVAASLTAMAAAGKSEVLDRVRSLYRVMAPQSVAQLMNAVEAGDAAMAGKVAQALKSMSLNIGAKEVARRAAEMEQAARDGSPPGLPAVASLKEVLTETMTLLGCGGGAVADAAAPQTPVANLYPSNVTITRATMPPETRALLDDLYEAIDSDQLSLVYQPQYDREGRNILGVETLVRWEHPVRGVVSPVDFIPVAEAWGRIHRLTDWVMRQACEETKDLHGLQVAFNASALEFTDSNLVDRIEAVLQKTGFDPHRLEVEITETAILNNEEQVRENMCVLRERGLKVALDDFGAGYSSLGHLRRYPFDKLKIDREFVTDCTGDVQAATVVHAVVSIGRALGMKVVAEGVETEQQRSFLKIAGVHAMQGYLFGKPMPISALKAMLEGEAARAVG